MARVKYGKKFTLIKGLNLNECLLSCVVNGHGRFFLGKFKENINDHY